MSLPAIQPDSREWHLMNSSLTARLPTVEMQELETFLLDNPELQLAYWELCTLHADLRLTVSARQATESVRAVLARSVAPPTPDILPSTKNVLQVDAPLSGLAEVSAQEASMADLSPDIPQEAGEGAQWPALGIAAPDITSPDVEFGSRTPVLGFLGTAVHLSARWLASPKLLALTIVGCLATYFIGLMLSIAITRFYLQNRDDTKGLEDSTRAAVRIVATDAARWQDGPPRGSANARLPNGTSRLAAGSVEIEFDGGARVIIEGPAEFMPQSGERMQLNRGRLLAHVPKPARGFTVVTPTAELVDLGTEFGVAVDDAGSTDLHVLKGRVAVNPAKRRSSNQSVAAGQAVRVSVDNPTPVRIEFSNAQFEQAHWASATPTPAPSPDDFLHGAPIWLGNLFDDPRGTPLADAVRSDTFKAVPKPHWSLGVERTFHDGTAFDSDDGKEHVVHGSWTRIAPGTIVDLGSLGWMGARSGAIANDAIGRYGDHALTLPELPAGTIRPGGGISTRNTVPVAPDAPKIEEGIGMRADALLTFDLDEIRAAGELAGRKLVFVCPRAGIADGDEGPRTWASVHFAVFVSAADGNILSAVVNGHPVHLVQNKDKIWSIVEAAGKPLKGDDDPISFVVSIAPEARYLTLVTANADFSVGMDLSVWSGACLKVVH